MIFYLPLLTLLVPALAAPVHSSLPIPPRSTLSHISCLRHPPFTPHWTIEQDPHKCLALCGSLSPDFSAVIRARTTYGSGISSPQPRLDEYDCLCAETTLLDATPLIVNDHSCGSGGWVVYTPILPWDAMNLPQQKYEHRLAADRGQRAYQALMKDRLRKRPSLAACPDGFKVCPSADGDGSFECVDVQTSLTSCGACVVGEAGRDDLSSKLGTDCTALPGISDKGVQCKAGSCIATSCLEGFVLSDDRCVRV
ncbi:hypothetical protein DB88DRAFT_375465 [Papiliotrema laurentii]|uniref:Protein CPL1-like domain-containing protein n=1 Tax=Papiliotrema laurentii TaxID=5418 RepID=A0AAD9FMG3_PAPLA|nr:hypothetical protein DB88DRAFT_375465 [Papiliotrema laurentii]